MRRTGTFGFSLIELLVVVVLTVVVLTIAGLPVQQYRMRMNVKRAAAEFASAYDAARTAAVRYGRGSTMRIDPAKDSYQIESDTSSAGKKLDMGRKFTGVDLVSDRTRLCFDGRGMPLIDVECQSHNATITFQTAYRTDTVRITALGLVRR